METRIFHTGDKVRCQGHSQDLIVTGETTITPEQSSVPHYRIFAQSIECANGYPVIQIEARERFFVKAIPYTITEEYFRQAIGRDPEDDELARVNCQQAGESGHRYCGWCSKHDKPIFDCGCEI